jgi:DnaJ-class molecular chaperone
LSRTALQFHPDMQHTLSDKTISSEQRTEKFRNISEAWFVLSKMELRAQYDAARVRSGMMKATSAMQNNGAAIDIPTSFNTQRDSFGVALKKAGQDWKNNRDKYKCEKWHKLTLDEKKV